jgi:penicillin-binding protein 1A
LDEYSVTFLDRFGNEIGKRGLLRDDSVPLEEIPDMMIKATLATEDRRFFEHFGVDVMGTIRALAENARADAVVQGGSSLTQQLAKNMFLSPERSLTRKIKEALIAVYLEAHYTKPEILKLYFDRAYLGGGSYGVEAAAQFYFGKSIRDVSLAEASMLAGMFKAPTAAPHIDLAASRKRAMKF